MQHKDRIEFHNVAELVPWEHPRGVALYRYSREAIAHLTTLGHHAGACSDGVELRFGPASHWVSLTLSARSNYPFSEGAKVEVYRGDVLLSSTTIPDGATRTLKLAVPPLLAELPPAALAGGRFSPEIWRVRLSGATVIYHDIDAGGVDIRPPTDAEKPRRRWLAYGSSITNAVPGYVHHAARLLDVDVFNKGLCGACFCEPETARFLANCEAWDFATLELGVNMRPVVPTAEFEARARELVATLRAAAPEKPLALITTFPNIEDYRPTPSESGATNRDYREALRRVHADARDPHLHLIEGDQVFTDFALLSPDFVHPTGDGHYAMGHHLAALLRPILQGVFRDPA